MSSVERETGAVVDQRFDPMARHAGDAGSLLRPFEGRRRIPDGDVPGALAELRLLEAHAAALGHRFGRQQLDGVDRLDALRPRLEVGEHVPDALLRGVDLDRLLEVHFRRSLADACCVNRRHIAPNSCDALGPCGLLIAGSGTTSGRSRPMGVTDMPPPATSADERPALERPRRSAPADELTLTALYKRSTAPTFSRSSSE